jgi:hypothetical protein
MVRGHWRIIVQTKDEKNFIVDKHTEKGALEALNHDLLEWLGQPRA